jgi:hypothetical protein
MSSLSGHMNIAQINIEILLDTRKSNSSRKSNSNNMQNTGHVFPNDPVRIKKKLLLKVANIRCFIPIAVEIFHNIIRK